MNARALQPFSGNHKIISFAVFVPLLIVLLIMFLSSGISYLYRFNYGVSDIYRDYLAGLTGGLLLTVAILLMPFRHKNLLLLAWIVKLSIVFFFDLVYEGRYYSLDAYSYFATATDQPVFIPVLFDATHNMYVLSSYVTTFLYPSYRLCLVIFSFVGLMAQYLFYRAAVNLSAQESRKLLLIFLFFPSMIFWSHILGKDPIVLFFIALYVVGLCYLIRRQAVNAFSLLVISFTGLFFFRFWIAGILVISIILSILIISNMRIIRRMVILMFATASGLFVLKIVLDQFQIHDWSQYFELLVRISPAWSQGGSAQNITIFTAQDYVLNMPYLMFSVLFRPLFFEAENILQFFSGVENVLLLLYAAGAVWYFLKYRLFKHSIIMIMLVHIIIWSAVYAPLSAQNLGTAVRYKLQILPFMITFIYSAFHYKRNTCKTLCSRQGSIHA